MWVLQRKSTRSLSLLLSLSLSFFLFLSLSYSLLHTRSHRFERNKKLTLPRRLFGSGGSLFAHNVKCIVCDEGDELLSLSHQKHTLRLLKTLPRPTKKRCKIAVDLPNQEGDSSQGLRIQVVLASATVPSVESLALLKKFVPKYSMIRHDEKSRVTIPSMIKVCIFIHLFERQREGKWM